MKILHVLIMFGLLAANVVNGSALQRKLKKGNRKDISGNRKTVYGGDANECYRKNFAGNLPPVGLRDPMNFFIRYICQKDYQDDGTHYGTMFDRQFGIPVYSAYTLTEDKVNFKEWTRPEWRQTQGIEEQGSDEIYPSLPFHRGHLAPARTLSDTGYRDAGFRSTFVYTNAVPQRPTFNSGQWSKYERLIRDYAVNRCTKGDGTLYLLTGSSFMHWIPKTDYFKVKNPRKALKLANEDLPQIPAITVPSSLWTAGCCVKGGTAVGNFAVFGNNAEDPSELYTNQMSMDTLQWALTTDKARGKTEDEVNLFPAFPGCMDDAKEVKFTLKRRRED